MNISCPWWTKDPLMASLPLTGLDRKECHLAGTPQPRPAVIFPEALQSSRGKMTAGLGNSIIYGFGRCQQWAGGVMVVPLPLTWIRQILSIYATPCKSPKQYFALCDINYVMNPDIVNFAAEFYMTPGKWLFLVKWREKVLFLQYFHTTNGMM